jgi:phage terminase small subunit
MMRGKPPKPTVLKLITGNPGHRPINQNEPKPKAGCTKPSFLDEAASAVWDEFAPELIRVGLLTEADRLTFGRLCVLAAQIIRQPVVDPNKDREFRLRCSEFGMTPTARARLSVNVGNKSKDQSSAMR